MPQSLTGNLYRTADGRNTYDIYDARADMVVPVARRLQTQVGLIAPARPVFAIDGVSLELVRDNLRLDMGWSNWFGVYITASLPEAYALVEKIGACLDTASQEVSIAVQNDHQMDIAAKLHRWVQDILHGTRL